MRSLLIRLVWVVVFLLLVPLIDLNAWFIGQPEPQMSRQAERRGHGHYID
jgi:hypothetical protein